MEIGNINSSKLFNELNIFQINFYSFQILMGPLTAYQMTQVCLIIKIEPSVKKNIFLSTTNVSTGAG